MRWIVLCMVIVSGFLLACGGCIGGAYRLAAPRSVDRQYQTAATIRVTCAEGTAMGSGTLVSDRQVLTALHVVACGGPITAEVGGVSRRMVIDRTDANADVVLLAALDGATWDAPAPVKVARVPARGGRICIVATVPRLGRKCGDVHHRNADLPGDVIHDAITEPGNSGGGVYDTHGRFIGVVTHLFYCFNGQVCGGRITSIEDREWLIP